MAIKINGQDLLKRYINGQEIVRVYKNGGQIRPETVPPVFSDYLCFTAGEVNSTATLSRSGAAPSPIELEISYDKVSWTDYTIGDTITLANVGDKVYWRNKSETPTGNIRGYRFSMSGKIGASGDANSLFCKSSTLSLPGYGFGGLFYGCTSLTTAPKLPATTLANECYYSMFNGCTSLTIAPQLPATTLTYNCYNGMFEGCTSLTTAPQLPATTLAAECYYRMFKDCTSLTNAPTILPATILTGSCYYRMFEGCTSLQSAPQLPATTLADRCYERMFYGCTSLITAPQLPAMTLAKYCYQLMFLECSSLQTPPQLPATTLADFCYATMFGGCSSLEKIPVLPATTLAPACYGGMISGCPLIKISDTQTGEYQTPYRIPSSGTGVDATDSMLYMFDGTGGTFIDTPSINTTYYTSNQVI